MTHYSGPIRKADSADALITFRDIEKADWSFQEDADAAAEQVLPVIPAQELEGFFGRDEVKAEALGIRLSPGFEVETLAPWLDQVALVEVHFPAYPDGRGYSQARLLREHMGFQGELRAVGDILIDQLRYFQRCGFDSAQLAPHVDPSDAVAALDRYGVWYQSAADDRPPVHRLRRFVQNWDI